MHQSKKLIDVLGCVGTPPTPIPPIRPPLQQHARNSVCVHVSSHVVGAGVWNFVQESEAQREKSACHTVDGHSSVQVGHTGGGGLRGGKISWEISVFQEGNCPLAKFRGVGSVVQVLELRDSQGWRTPPLPCKRIGQQCSWTMKERWLFGLCHGGLSVAKYPLIHGRNFRRRNNPRTKFPPLPYLRCTPLSRLYALHKTLLAA